jgi:hypothetical protein
MCERFAQPSGRRAAGWEARAAPQRQPSAVINTPAMTKTEKAEGSSLLVPGDLLQQRLPAPDEALYGRGAAKFRIGDETSGQADIDGVKQFPISRRQSRRTKSRPRKRPA